MHADRLGDDLADGHARIERGVGVLEDDLHLLAHGDHRLAVEPGEVDVLEADLAPGRLVETQHQAAERGFSAARTRRPGPASRRALMSIVTSSTARTSLALRRKPMRTGKYFLACLMSRIGDGICWPSTPGFDVPAARCQRRIERLDLRHAMAGGQVPRLAHHERRIGAGTSRWRTGSAGGSGSPTAGRAGWAARRRWWTSLAAAPAIEPRHGGQQAARVGVQRAGRTRARPCRSPPGARHTSRSPGRRSARRCRGCA